MADNKEIRVVEVQFKTVGDKKTKKEIEAVERAMAKRIKTVGALAKAETNASNERISQMRKEAREASRAKTIAQRGQAAHNHFAGQVRRKTGFKPNAGGVRQSARRNDGFATGTVGGTPLPQPTGRHISAEAAARKLRGKMAASVLKSTQEFNKQTKLQLDAEKAVQKLITNGSVRKPNRKQIPHSLYTPPKAQKQWKGKKYGAAGVGDTRPKGMHPLNLLAALGIDTTHPAVKTQVARQMRFSQANAKAVASRLGVIKGAHPKKVNVQNSLLARGLSTPLMDRVAAKLKRENIKRTGLKATGAIHSKKPHIAPRNPEWIMQEEAWKMNRQYDDNAWGKAHSMNRKYNKDVWEDAHKMNRRYDFNKMWEEAHYENRVFDKKKKDKAEAEKNAKNQKDKEDKLDAKSEKDKETEERKEQNRRETAERRAANAKKQRRRRQARKRLSNYKKRQSYVRTQGASGWRDIKGGFNGIKSGIGGAHNSVIQLMGEITMIGGMFMMIGTAAIGLATKLVALGDAFAAMDKKFTASQAYRSSVGGSRFDLGVGRAQNLSGFDKYSAGAMMANAGNQFESLGGKIGPDTLKLIAESAAAVSATTGVEFEDALTKVVEAAESGEGKKLNIQGIKLTKNINKNIEEIARAAKADPMASQFLKGGTIGTGLQMMKSSKDNLLGELRDAHGGQLKDMFMGIGQSFMAASGSDKTIERWGMALTNLDEAIAYISDPNRTQKMFEGAASWAAIMADFSGIMASKFQWLLSNPDEVIGSFTKLADAMMMVANLKMLGSIMTLVGGIGKLAIGLNSLGAALTGRAGLLVALKSMGKVKMGAQLGAGVAAGLPSWLAGSAAGLGAIISNPIVLVVGALVAAIAGLWAWSKWSGIKSGLTSPKSTYKPGSSDISKRKIATYGNPGEANSVAGKAGAMQYGSAGKFDNSAITKRLAEIEKEKKQVAIPMTTPTVSQAGRVTGINIPMTQPTVTQAGRVTGEVGKNIVRDGSASVSYATPPTQAPGINIPITTPTVSRAGKVIGEMGRNTITSGSASASYAVPPGRVLGEAGINSSVRTVSDGTASVSYVAKQAIIPAIADGFRQVIKSGTTSVSYSGSKVNGGVQIPMTTPTATQAGRVTGYANSVEKVYGAGEARKPEEPTSVSSKLTEKSKNVFIIDGDVTIGADTTFKTSLMNFYKGAPAGI